MARTLLLFLFAAALSSSGWAADQTCKLVVLRNGFTMQYVRREADGPSMRLWLCGDSGTGYVEVGTQQIERYEEPAGPPVQASSIAPQAPARPARPIGNRVDDLIASAASRHRIDPDFVASVVKAESGFVPSAVSSKGAGGLMQITPQTAASLGIKNVLDPADNVEGGTKYLRQLLDRYDGDAVMALAAFNAGPQRVDQYGGVPPYPETRAYITRVIDDFNRKKLQQQTTTTSTPAAK